MKLLQQLGQGYILRRLGFQINYILKKQNQAHCGDRNDIGWYIFVIECHFSLRVAQLALSDDVPGVSDPHRVCGFDSHSAGDASRTSNEPELLVFQDNNSL
jgi:hypothetical protein